MRYGADDSAVDVFVKVSDFLSEYGADYVIAGPDGKEFKAADGVTVDLAGFIADDETRSDGGAGASKAGTRDAAPEPDGIMGDPVPEAPEEAETVTEKTKEAEETVKTVEAVRTLAAAADETAPPEAMADAVPEAPEETSEDAKTVETVTEETPEDSKSVTDAVPETPKDTAKDTKGAKATAKDSKDAKLETYGPIYAPKKEISTGSSLLDAAYSYLDIPLTSEEQETEDNLAELLETRDEYMLASKGASGIVSFKKGEREKKLTIRAVDNEDADGTRLFLVALIATNNKAVSIAPDANTYVNLLDDEDREPSAYTLDVDNENLTAENPSTVVTVRRTEGTQYFLPCIFPRSKATPL